MSKNSYLDIKQDQHGFVATDHCDSTLFSGMLSAGGMRVNMTAAEKSPGEWLRRPTSYPECWGCGKSRSTISRDMLLGVYWDAWRHGDLPMLERLWRYGVKHGWRMGKGRWFGADTVMNTAMISTLAQMIYRLGGENHWIARRLPTFWSVKDEHYKNRLTALHLGLRREVFGPLGWYARDTVLELAELFPDNPLFLWAAGHRYKYVLDKGIEYRPSGIHSPDEYVYEWIFVNGQPQPSNS